MPNEKGYCAFVTLRGLAASYQSVIAGDTWQSRDLWQCSRPFQSRFPLPARGVPEYRRIKDILGHLKSAVGNRTHCSPVSRHWRQICTTASTSLPRPIEMWRSRAAIEVWFP